MLQIEGYHQLHINVQSIPNIQSTSCFVYIMILYIYIHFTSNKCIYIYIHSLLLEENKTKLLLNYLRDLFALNGTYCVWCIFIKSINKI